MSNNYCIPMVPESFFPELVFAVGHISPLIYRPKPEEQQKYDDAKESYVERRILKSFLVSSNVSS